MVFSTQEEAIRHMSYCGYKVVKESKGSTIMENGGDSRVIIKNAKVDFEMIEEN